MLKADCISEIQKISRRQHDGSVNAADLTEAASLNELQEKMDSYFSGLDEHGVQLASSDLLQDVRVELCRQSEKSLSAIKGHIEEIKKILVEHQPYCSGIEGFSSIIEKLNQKMFEIREGNDRVAMRTRALVEEFTDEMMPGSNKYRL